MMFSRLMPLALLPLLMSCAADGSPPASKPVAGTGAIAKALDGTRWNVTEIGGKSPARGTIEFKEGRIFGSGGCNRYTGGVKATASGGFAAGAFESGQVAMTMMACPESVMENEQAFMEALATADRWAIVADDRLELSSGKKLLLKASRIKAD